jgi:hypothetical protein
VGEEPEDPFPPLNKPLGVMDYQACQGCAWAGPRSSYDEHVWQVHRVKPSHRDGAQAEKILSDGREATLYALLMGSGRILIGPPGDMGGDEEFMFYTYEDACRAILQWDGYGQPQGWTRWKVGTKEYVKDKDGQPISKEDRDRAEFDAEFDEERRRAQRSGIWK